MFDAIFTASSGQSFSFGYKAGVLYSIDPIGDLPVELETSQGYQQVGATVESRSISGVTRTVKEMTVKGYLTKTASEEDGRVTYLSITEAGAQLSQTYDKQFFDALVPCLQGVPEADVETTIRTIEAFHQVFCERRTSLEI